ncbi:hypothetical protein DBR06_SOUSAS1610097, partial [Sousa chinensis]
GLPADKEARVDCSRLLRTTGRGSFAKVTLAQMAIRVVKETQQSSSSLQHFHEVHSMKVLNHP